MATNPSKKKSTDNSKSTIYWQRLLEEFSSPLRLWLEGFDIHIRTDLKNTEPYHSTKKTFNSHLTEALENLSKKNDFTLPNLLQAAWGILLNRYSGSNKILYGLTTLDKANKKNISITNPLIPILSDISNNNSINTYLKELSEQLLKHNKHLKSLPDIRNEVNYLYIDATHKNQNEKVVLNQNQIPLALMVHSLNPVKIQIIYNHLKYSPESIDNILKHYIVILEKMIPDTEQSVARFSILTKEENKKILGEWSKPTYSPHDIYQEKTMMDLFAVHAKKDPHHLAIHYQDKSLTYQEFDEYSNQLSHFLQQKNIKTGDAVVVLMERTPAIMIAMMAIFKIGAIFVPINPKYPDDRIQFIISDCDCKLILVNTTDRIDKEFLEKTIIFNDDYSILKDIHHDVIKTKTDPATIAYAVYTSGTTGQPKGVQIKHNSLTNLSVWYKRDFAVTKQDKASQFASQGFDTFFCETIPYFALGASVHIIDDNSKLTPSLFLPWLAEQEITICDLPTAYGQILFTMTWPQNLKLRFIKVGGESITHYPEQALPFDIWNGYGPTEATVEAIFAKIFLANTAPDQQPLKHTPPPIGKPIDNFEAYIVDQYLQPVPIGIVGELLIGGRGLSPGYINRPQLTREKFIRNVFSDDPHSKLYKTGDLARWLNDGNIEFIGRADHQVKIRGYRIELGEIETTISQFSDVREAVVLVKEVTLGQKNLVAYIVPNLEKIRIPYQDRCLLAINDITFIDVLLDDISKEGVAITGLSEQLEINQSLKISIKLPGLSDSRWLSGHVIWQKDQRAGILFDDTPEQKKILQKSIEYYLSTNNLMKTLQSASAKRSIRQALKSRLPEYMIPTVFTILTEFPLTLNGKVDVRSLPLPQELDRLLDRKYVAPRNATEKTITEMWSNILNQKQISITDNFFDLGGNSLLVSQLSVMIMKKFKLSVPAKILFDLPFIPILAEYIQSKGKKYTFSSTIQDEIFQDSILIENIVPVKEPNEFIHHPRGILLTGAAGFLGIYLLRELLNKTEAKIYCLIRKGGFESVAKRLMENINHYTLGNEVSLANRRIVIIAGDIGLDKFGIPEEQYNNMIDKIDMVFHCGAQVNTMASYTNLRNSNVQGTLEVIKFSTQKVNKPIHYISTLSAAYKKDSAGRFSEEFPDANPDELVGGYAISKWVSERLLTQLKNRGLPVCIYRSGYILGQSDTGITNLNDALLLLIKGCMQLGFAPDWKEKISILPVDFVSQSIVEIALYHPEKSEVFHIDHPNGMMWLDIIAWLNNDGYKIKTCSHSEWLDLLTKITQENALFPFLPHYLAQQAIPSTPDTAMEHAIQTLEKIGLPYPEIDDSLLHRYMNYLCDVGFFPTPENRKQPVNDISGNT